MFSHWKERWKDVLRISWPLIIANSFWNLQITIDRIFIGNYSVDGLGATMAVGALFWAPMALVQQTAAYSTTFVAQYLGAKQFDKIGPAVWQALYLGVMGGLLFLLLIPLAPHIFAWMGHSPRMQELEVEYFIALTFSSLPIAIVAAISGFFTGRGISQTVMWINGVGLIANVVFDYLMIFGNLGFPEMGLAGAGYATSIASWCSALFGLWLMLTKENERLFCLRSGWRWSRDLMGRYIKFGVPSGLQWALEGLGFSVFLVIIGQMPNGDVALSASGIAVTIMMLAVLPALGVAQGVMVMVGQFLGDKNPEQAESSAWAGLHMAIVYESIMALSFVIFPGFYLSWFHNAENAAIWAQVSEIVPVLLLFVASFVSLDAINLVFSMGLKGAGDTRFVTLVALVLPWPLMVFPTWLASDRPDGVYLAWAAASIFIACQAGVFFWRFLGGKWKTMSVIN